jgi:hypothetical protein
MEQTDESNGDVFGDSDDGAWAVGVCGLTIPEMIERGLSLVQDDPHHDLRAGFRCRLLSAFDQMSGGEGRRRRTRLAQLTVEKVLPLWETLFPADHTPREALDLSEEVLAGTILPTVAQQGAHRLWTHCDDLLWRHTDKQAVIMVGYGAIQAIREALSEWHFGCAQLSDESTDLDVDPYDSDSPFCAAVAYSGGAPWEESSDADKRLEFWAWWLTSVVRTAADGA